MVRLGGEGAHGVPARASGSGSPAPRQQTRVGDLSGGERRRLQLTRLLMDEPNVLLLDEPTNDLDIETLTSLEDLLDGWAGTLSSSRTTATCSSGSATARSPCSATAGCATCPAASRSTSGCGHAAVERSAVPVADAGRAASGGGASPPGGGAAVGARGDRLSPAEAREARKTMARVEKQLARLAQREEKLHAAMLASATDHEKVLGLNRELREVVDEREVLELEWLEAAEVVG